jgi:hypothetical protein
MPPGATAQFVEKYTVDPSPAVPVQPSQFARPIVPELPGAAAFRIHP